MIDSVKNGSISIRDGFKEFERVLLRSTLVARLTHYTQHEGGSWIAYEGARVSRRFLKSPHSLGIAHSLKFDDGREWDEINGWRLLGNNNG